MVAPSRETLRAVRITGSAGWPVEGRPDPRLDRACRNEVDNGGSVGGTAGLDHLHFHDRCRAGNTLAPAAGASTDELMGAHRARMPAAVLVCDPAPAGY